MFGYFRPYDAGLTANQLKTFRAYYCRLCCGLRSAGGQRARYLTTFDATIYYMIYNMAVGAPTPTSFRCQKLSKTNMRIAAKDELAMRFVKAVLIAIGEKMRDDRLDGDKAKARFISVMFGKAIRTAQSDEAELAKATYDGTELINRMQESCAATDELLDAYGEVLAGSLRCIGEVDSRYAELYKSIAAWTFYVDILCDYDEDYKKARYNPLKREGVASLAELFNAEYAELMQLNKRVCDRVINALNGAKNDSAEWQTVYKILIHAMTSVVPDLLVGKNVKFKYFKELFKNIKLMKKSRKRFDEAETVIKRQS